MAKLGELTNRNISYLDGDIVRLNLSQGLGFSLSDRSNKKTIHCTRNCRWHAGKSTLSQVDGMLALPDSG